MSLVLRITLLAQAIAADIKIVLGRAIPSGGTTGQALIKSSNSDYAANWGNIIAAALSGYVSNTGTIAATDTILSAIGKLNGNVGTKANIAAAQVTRTDLTFSQDTMSGTIAAPITGNITGSTTGAVLGVVCVVIHNSGTAPTFDSKFKKLSGSGAYIVNQVNYIFCQYISSTQIIYSINQVS